MLNILNILEEPMRIFKAVKADEMEMEINFKSMRLAWIFINLVLLAWLIISLVKKNEDYQILLIIILAQNIVFFASKLIYTKIMIKNNDEE